MDISQSFGSDTTKHTQDLCCQKELATAVVAAHLAGDSDLDKHVFGDSLLLPFATASCCRNFSMMVITHVNANAVHFETAHAMISLTDRLKRAIESVKQPADDRAFEGHLRDIANLELLTTRLQNLTLTAGHTDAAYTRLMDNLLDQILKINDTHCCPEEELMTYPEDYGGSLIAHASFKRIMEQLRVLSLRASENEIKVEQYILQVNEISKEVENCKKRKEELKKALEEYKENTDGDAEKLGEYSEELNRMRQTVKELKATDAEKEESLKLFQVSRMK